MKNTKILLLCTLPLVWLTNNQLESSIFSPAYIRMTKDHYDDYYNYPDKKVLLFDIDNTLYKNNSQLQKAEREGHMRVLEMYKRIIIDAHSLYKDGFPIDLGACYETFRITPLLYEQIKDVDYQKYIEGDFSRLKNYLSKSEFRLWCFTNGLECRARAILRKMGIERYFEGVIVTDDENKNPIRKPNIKAYEFVEQLLGVKSSSIYFFDDLIRNVETAQERRWNAFLVRQDEDIVDLLNKLKFCDKHEKDDFKQEECSTLNN